jgi:hypothetical protein
MINRWETTGSLCAPVSLFLGSESQKVGGRPWSGERIQPTACPELAEGTHVVGSRIEKCEGPPEGRKRQRFARTKLVIVELRADLDSESRCLLPKTPRKWNYGSVLGAGFPAAL